MILAMPESENSEKKTVDEVLKKAEAESILKENEKAENPLTPVTTDINEIQSNLDEVEKKKLEEQRGKMKTLSIALGIDKQTEEIDTIKTQITMIAEKITEIAGVISKQNDTINTMINGSQTTSSTGTDNETGQLEKLELLSKLADSEIGKAVIKKFIGGDTPPPSATPLISQEWLNEKMKNSVMENFQLGETILDSVKNSLKKKAVQNITNNALVDTGLDKTHEPA